jgi:hypothetical protein
VSRDRLDIVDPERKVVVAASPPIRRMLARMRLELTHEMRTNGFDIYEIRPAALEVGET